ncbi:hypothetical protein [Nitrospirillum pindoramense]|uniref:Uncharacterized protein n=1 Tax=Nitrospirillum amazonense TaxID=28077 RepID=A0A560H7M1_9PROT|nr:hypothetical protein [Nitrospirillum amazonense]TWB41819.1 hypothetical protein FBZ90_107194 [Nitrospirillum amazonense]
MTDEHRDAPGPDGDAGSAAPGAVPATPAAPSPDIEVSSPPVPAAVREGEIDDGVDPFDYAESIVRDLALHVGGRLRDLRNDLTAMHSAVVSLPETMRINALGQSIQELRERVAHLTGVVSHHAGRPAEEAERLARGVGELSNTLQDVTQRVGVLENWLSHAKAVNGVRLPDLPPGPLPEQLNNLVDHLHESLLRVVNAVRATQLDVRDLRDQVRGGVPALPPPAAEGKVAEGRATDAKATVPDTGAVQALAGRLDAVEEKLRRAPASAPADRADGGTAGLASLVFGAWPSLMRPTGAEALAQAVASVLDSVGHILGGTVQLPQTPQDGGLVAVATGRHRGMPLAILVGVEDLVGRHWVLGEEGDTLSDSGFPRVSTLRGLMNAAALVEKSRPGTLAVSILIYGNGVISQAPTRDALSTLAQAAGIPGAAGRTLLVAAGDLTAAGLLPVHEVGGAVSDLQFD